MYLIDLFIAKLILYHEKSYTAKRENVHGCHIYYVHILNLKSHLVFGTLKKHVFTNKLLVLKQIMNDYVCAHVH